MKNLIKRTKDMMSLDNPDNFEIEEVDTRLPAAVRTVWWIFKRTIGLIAILLIGYHLDFPGTWWKNVLLLLVAAVIWDMYA